MFCNLVDSSDYKFYEKIRSIEYHCLRQEYVFYDKQINVFLGKMYIVLILLENLFPVLDILVEDERTIVTNAVDN